MHDQLIDQNQGFDQVVGYPWRLTVDCQSLAEVDSKDHIRSKKKEENRPHHVVEIVETYIYI